MKNTCKEQSTRLYNLKRHLTGGKCTIKLHVVV